MLLTWIFLYNSAMTFTFDLKIGQVYYKPIIHKLCLFKV